MRLDLCSWQEADGSFAREGGSPRTCAKVAPRGRFRDAEDLRWRFPDPRIGSDPSRANAGDGQRLLEAAVEDLREGYRDLLSA